MPSSLGDDAYKRSLAANQRAAHVVATAGFFVSVGLGWGRVCNTDCVACGPVCGVGVGWGGVGFATQTVLCAVLSVGLGWSGFCNTDRVACGPVCGVGVGWGGMGFATQTELRAVLSVGMGWGWGVVCNTDRVMCGPVCGDGVGWGVVCNNDCYERSCLWGWGGVGFATQTVLCPGPIGLAISRCCQCTMT